MDRVDGVVIGHARCPRRQRGSVMSKTRLRNQEDFIEKAVAVLMANLGPVETSRFLNLLRKPRIESVKRHRQWQEGLDQETFFSEAFAEKNE